VFAAAFEYVITYADALAPNENTLYVFDPSDSAALFTIQSPVLRLPEYSPTRFPVNPETVDVSDDMVTILGPAYSLMPDVIVENEFIIYLIYNKS
jgi:hypothetical protein